MTSSPSTNSSMSMTSSPSTTVPQQVPKPILRQDQLLSRSLILKKILPSEMDTFEDTFEDSQTD